MLAQQASNHGLRAQDLRAGAACYTIFITDFTLAVSARLMPVTASPLLAHASAKSGFISCKPAAARLEIFVSLLSIVIVSTCASRCLGALRQSSAATLRQLPIAFRASTHDPRWSDTIDLGAAEQPCKSLVIRHRQGLRRQRCHPPARLLHPASRLIYSRSSIAEGPYAILNSKRIEIGTPADAAITSAAYTYSPGLSYS